MRVSISTESAADSTNCPHTLAQFLADPFIFYAPLTSSLLFIPYSNSWILYSILMYRSAAPPSSSARKLVVPPLACPTKPHAPLQTPSKRSTFLPSWTSHLQHRRRNSCPFSELWKPLGPERWRLRRLVGYPPSCRSSRRRRPTKCTSKVNKYSHALWSSFSIRELTMVVTVTRTSSVLMPALTTSER